MPSYLSLSLACKKLRDIRRLFQKGLQVWNTPHWQHLHRFGLAVRKQQKIRHIGCQSIFFLFWLLASSLAEGITMPDEQKWGPALLSAALSPGTPSCEWLCWHWSSFCSLKPRGEERWKETLYVSACPNAPLPCNHRAGEFGLSTGVQRDICTVDKMFGEPWPPTIPHDRMPKLHVWVLQLLLPPQRSLALDEFSRAGHRGISFPLETTPRWSPKHDGKQSCVSLLLANFLRANNVLSLAAMQNVAQGVLSAPSSLFKVR